MEIERILEELEIEMLRNVQNKIDIPVGIKESVDKAFNKILDIYKDSQCDWTEISNYIDGSKDIIRSQLEVIKDSRVNNGILECSNIIKKMKKEAEEQQEIKDYRQDIMEINLGDNESVNKIIDILSDSLKDVKLHQSRILSSRGYRDERIYKINERIDIFINSLKANEKNKEKLNKIFDEDRNKLCQELINMYEKALEYSNYNDKETFKDTLRSGISLEEQQKYVYGIQKNNNTNYLGDSEIEDLPSDVII